MAARVLPGSIVRLLASLGDLSALWPESAVAKVLTSAAALGTLVALLKAASTSRNGKKVTDYRRIARSLATGERSGDQQSSDYDVVIVGGGAAGCVLASRLSEDPQMRVLLLEAGESTLSNPTSRIPAMYSQFFHTQYDYEIYTVPQEHAYNKRKFWPRGKMLGGCSSMNAMIAHHCAPSDYDLWAKIQKGRSGASDWSYKNFLPYLRKFEHYHPNPKHPGVDVSQHGQRGPMAVGHYGNFSDSSKRFIEACVNVGIPYTPDLNTPTGTLGISSTMTFIDSGGRRVTTESAYLTADVLKRPNLTVATGVQVTRVVFDQTQGKTPRAVGVHFMDAKGRTYEVTAQREVVLSAGAIHTPQILMLSGVGPASHLTSLSIPVIADLPGVGSHLTDHLLVDYHFRDKTKSVLAGLSHDPRRQGRFDLLAILTRLGLMAQWALTGRGPLTTNAAESMGFARSSDTALMARVGVSVPTPDSIEDTTTGPGAPDLEFVLTPMAWLDHACGAYPPGYHFGLHTVLLRPTGKGTVRLHSKDPADPPLVDPQYLSSKHDLAVLVRGARVLGAIMHTEPLSDILDPTGLIDTADGLLNHDLASKSDAELEALIRDRVETLYHPSSTARMAPLEDGGVVDPFLKVYCVDGLRIVDASVFPTIVSGHPVAPTIAVAEKAADLIAKSFRD